MRRTTSQSTPVKWSVLEHKGPVFPPSYRRLPDGVHFKYDGEVMILSEKAEEVMTYFAKCDEEFRKDRIVKQNFFNDWRETMSGSEKKQITEFRKCNFFEVTRYINAERDNEKAKKKEETKELNRLGYDKCTWNDQQERIGNFRVEQPGLFIPTNKTHPKRGKLKRRITPEDVVINCSDGRSPEPPEGRSWKDVVHENTVTWLASWKDYVQRKPKYIKLSPASSVKGEVDQKKYDAAQELKSKIEEIRNKYKEEMTDDDVMIRQRAVVLYFLDEVLVISKASTLTTLKYGCNYTVKRYIHQAVLGRDLREMLALRPGRKRSKKEDSDTVGCCSLRCGNIELVEHEGSGRHVVKFDFRGKGGVHYDKAVIVSEQVFENLSEFVEDKEETDPIFDELNVSELNKYLKDKYVTTAKVFRTFRASSLFQTKLRERTEAVRKAERDRQTLLIQSHKKANGDVARLCNHRRNIQTGSSSYGNETSKEHYIDPRITVAWCKKYNVPIEEIFNLFQQEKFAWAMETDDSYEF